MWWSYFIFLSDLHSPPPLLLPSGYEEAAAQGLLAGINAARRAQELEPIALTRDSSYLGTLIDDLVTKDLREPYRMLTSRSEYRLLLRSERQWQVASGKWQAYCSDFLATYHLSLATPLHTAPYATPPPARRYAAPLRFVPQPDR